MSPIEFPELLSVEQMARVLRVNKFTAYRYVESGRIPGEVIVRIGKTVRIRADRLRDWIEHGGNKH